MEVTADEIEVVSLSMLEKLVASGNSIAAVFSSSRDHGIGGIKDIHKLCVNLDVPMLHVLGQVCEEMRLVLRVCFPTGGSRAAWDRGGSLPGLL